MRNEFERLAARQPLELLSMKRSTQSTLLHIAKIVLLKNIVNIHPFSSNVMHLNPRCPECTPNCFIFYLCRYELPAPSSGQKNDITAWQDCVNNSMAQLEHQAVRIENLELMAHYGTNAWKVYNEWVSGCCLCTVELFIYLKVQERVRGQPNWFDLTNGARLVI